MKKLFITLIILSFPAVSCIQGQNNAYEMRQERTQWFREARFGMFIHWGIYAIPARGEWVRSRERISESDYQKYFDAFNPVDYNPRQWAALAKRAGMKYAVITAKHHDGFCLFDSKYTDYKATNTPAKRDLIKEFVEAFRAEGLKVGFYYSLIDWHHPDFIRTTDHPLVNNPEWENKKFNFDNYLDYMHKQVEELVTNYGKIDILWFDYSFGDYRGEKWKATKLMEMVRKYQPDIIIDNRLGGNMKSVNPEIYAGDFGGPEQITPPGIVLDDAGRPIPWELCMTLNNSWGYNKNDANYKSAEEIIYTLTNCVSKNGNLLLNVGPDEKGVIPQKSVEVLEEIGDWMKLNSESIYGCGPAQFAKPEWGWFTRKGNVIYAHLMNYNVGPYCLRKMKGKVQNATLLLDGSQLTPGEISNVNTNGPYVADDDLFINIRRLRPSPPNTTPSAPLPPVPPLNTKYRVVRIELAE